MNTKHLLNWRLSAVALAATATFAWAQEPAKPVVHSQTQTVEATVEAIDQAHRLLSLKGPNESVTVEVGPKARNFDQIKVGDKVVVSYYQGIAAQMKKSDSKAAAPAAATFAYPAAGGTKPGGGVGASVTATVTIVSVDTTHNSVTFKRSDGTLDIIAVKLPEMRKFIRTLQPGDQVEVTYTESLAVSVVPVK